MPKKSGRTIQKSKIPPDSQLVVLCQEFAPGDQRRQGGQNGEDRPAAVEDVLLRPAFVGDMGLKMGHLLPKDSHHVSHVNMLGGFNHLEKYESQWEELSHIYYCMENNK